MVDGLIVFIFGSSLGSFLNVCIYRLPKSLSMVTPRSYCPSCRKTIKWFDNIPLISYFILKGKCRYCNSKISLRYPLVELITGIVTLYLYKRFSFSWNFFEFLLFSSLLVLVSFIDIEYRAIPIYICPLGIILGLIFKLYESSKYLKSGIVDNLPIVNSFKGLVFGLGFTYLFKLFGDLLLGIYLGLTNKDSIEGEKESLGLGDVDFMGMVGTFLGTKSVITTFFIAPFLGLFYSLFALLFKKSHIVPYLPYLSLASFVSLIWAERIFTFIGF
ncbi:MAG: prepilin peptidase [Candidatus Omnitrophica bacterium]|nr:prepilin peptidase [Candidatus Omnitrophota bacterium]